MAKNRYKKEKQTINQTNKSTEESKKQIVKQNPNPESEVVFLEFFDNPY